MNTNTNQIFRDLIAGHRRHAQACRVHAAKLRRESRQLRELPAGTGRAGRRAHELARKALALASQAQRDRAAAEALAMLAAGEVTQ